MEEKTQGMEITILTTHEQASDFKENLIEHTRT